MYAVCAVLLFLWVAGIGTYLSWTKSMTSDEGVHVASAYLALTRGDNRFDPEHPFLFKYLTALPLLPLHLSLPPGDQEMWERAKPTLYDSWRESREWSERWFYKSGNDAKLMLFLARLPAVLVLLGLCGLVFYLGRKWFGPAVGLWAIFFTAFNPTLLAHGATTNTDVPFALTFLAVLWAFWSYGEKPSFWRAILAGLALGISLATKYSGLAVLPIVAVWLVYLLVTKKVRFWPLVGQSFAALAVVFLFIWCVYFFQTPLVWEPRVFDESVFQHSYLSNHGKDFWPKAEIIRWILPTPYLKGVFMTIGQTQGGKEMFVLGHHYDKGQWFYFPALFVLKTQVVGLLLFVWGLYRYRNQVRPRTWNPLATLMVVSVVIFGGLAMKSKLDIGVRHIAPLLVLLSFLCGITAVAVARRWTSFVAAAVALLYIAPVLWQANDPLAFSNEIILDKQESFRFFNDSNLDWGQQTEDLARFINRDLKGQPIYANYIWSDFALQYYGAATQHFDPAEPPASGFVLLTATQLFRKDGYLKFLGIKPAYVVDNNTFFYRASDIPPGGEHVFHGGEESRAKNPGTVPQGWFHNPGLE